MKLGRAVAGGAVLCVAVAACSDDGSPGTSVKCGAGTVLKDDTCVSAGGSGAGAGGSSVSGTANVSGSSGAGASATGGNGGTAGSVDHAGEGGVPSGAGTMSEQAGSDMGGSGGEGGEAPNPEPTVVPTRWLVFSHTQGVFAYDTTKFPSTDGLVSLSDKAQYPDYYGIIWSPNGHDVMFSDSGSVYAADMTGAVPGTPRLLLSNPAFPQSGLFLPFRAWSADSASVATLSKTTLSVLDPSQAAPTLHVVTTTAKYYRWAPNGQWLHYSDVGGEFVVSVDHGVLGNPVALPTTDNVWSPDGSHLAGFQDDELALVTLSGNAASVVALTDFNADTGGGAGGAGAGGVPAGGAAPKISVVDKKFNKDGSKLLLDTEGGPHGGDAYIVNIKPQVGTPKAVVTNAAPELGSFCTDWSPDGTLALCSAGDAWLAVDANGGAPTKVLDLPIYPTWVWSQNPAQHRLFTIDSYNMPTSLIMVDLAKPNTRVPLYQGQPTYSVSPTGTLLSYVVKPKVSVVDLSSPGNPPATIDTDQFAFDPPVVTWAPNGKFISVADGAYQQRLVRVDGSALSTPVALKGTSKNRTYCGWQP